MIKNKNWESLVWILMWMFILWLVLMWIANIIISSRDLSSQTLIDSSIYFLKNSSVNTLNKSDLSSLNLWEEFYLNKDKVSQTISILTWALNSQYMYIDRHWYYVADIVAFSWFIYTQTWRVTNIDDNLWFKHIMYDLTVKSY